MFRNSDASKLTRSETLPERALQAKNQVGILAQVEAPASTNAMSTPPAATTVKETISTCSDAVTNPDCITVVPIATAAETTCSVVGSAISSEDAALFLLTGQIV